MTKMIATLLLALSVSLSAQTPTPIPANNATATTVWFKHDGVDTTSYRFCAQPTQGNPICADIGKPAPDANGERSAKLQALVAGTYTLSVVAVGPGGSVGLAFGSVAATNVPALPSGIRLVVTVTIVVGG